ncbi:unnamed protein product [Boreogadus saida]
MRRSKPHSSGRKSIKTSTFIEWDKGAVFKLPPVTTPVDFLQAQPTCRVGHPGIPKVLDSGEETGSGEKEQKKTIDIGTEATRVGAVGEGGDSSVPPLLEEGSIEEEPVLQGPPESEQSEKEEPVQSPLLEEGSIEEEPEQREGGEELSEPVLQESSESGQSEEEGPDQSPEQLRRTTRTTAGIHSNPFDLPRSAVRKVEQSKPFR